MDEIKLGEEKRFTPEFIFAALLALILVPLYLYCLPPVLPPYRDSGEMASAAWTLGVAHQPGYPLYIISAKLFSLIPLGNPAWRLNLFSALAGLSGVLVFWRLAAVSFSPLAAFFAALFLGFNFTLRTVSSVPEMYALNFFFAALLLASASLRGSRAIMLSAFLLGLGMANRMDLLLAAPAVLILLGPSLKEGGWKALLRSAGFFFLGFSLYLYLPFRSSGWPLFDWSHPADLKTFLAVITRKSYGSTLDLISLNYAPGELFLPNLKYYAAHLWTNFSFGLALVAAGIWAEWKSARRRLLALAALFVFAGPVFLFMANMPPNPHALAIVEPYYLLPDLAAAFWAAAGFFYLAGLLPRAFPGLVIAAAAAAALVFYNGAHGSARRWLFAAEDYASDVMRSAPPGSVVVAKKDVQIFSLWYMQTVRGLRPDLNLVAQGLSGSPWYRATKKRYDPGLALYNLNTGDEREWRNLAAANPGGVYATMDADLPRAVRPTPYGALNLVSPGARAPEVRPWLFYSFPRLDRHYRDFFDRDIGTSYAQAFLSGAIRRSSGPGGLDAGALRDLRLASLLDGDLPDAPLYEGFYYSSRGDWPAARDCFRASADTYERLLALSLKYYSLPALKEGLASASAYAWLNYGVALEKTGDRQGAAEAYGFALTRNPGLADAHYNLAILYWGRDWEKVRFELAETLRLNPSHAQAAKYLQQLKPR